MVLKYLLPFLASFVLSVFFIVCLKFFFGRMIFSSRKGVRHPKGKRVMRLGGMAIILAFNLAVIIDRDLFIDARLYGLMFVSWIILAVGILDDFREISWKYQLLFQTIFAVLIFSFGVRIQAIRNPFAEGMIFFEYPGWQLFFSFAISLFWILMMINSMNWLDGIDGAAGGIFFIGVSAIFALSLRPEVNQPPIAILCLMLGGASLGFLLFNFYPGRIIAGTAGSTFMGFAIAALAIYAGTKVATSIMVLFLPIIDFIWVIGGRIRRKKSIFEADRSHLHHKLLDLGWSQRKVTLFFYGITAINAVIALNTDTSGKSIAFAAMFACAVGLFFLINKRLERSGLSEAGGA